MANSIDRKPYIDKITDPRTPEDFLLALQNPHSFISRQVTNQMAEIEDTNALTEFVIRILSEKAANTAQQEKDNSRAELLRDEIYMLEAKRLQKESRQERSLLFSSPHANLLSDSAAENLKKAMEARVKTIKALEHQYKQLENKLQKTRDTNINDWQEVASTQAQTFSNQLDLNGITLKNAAGEPVGTENMPTKSLIAKAFRSPAPIEIIEVVADSWEKKQQEDHQEQIKQGKTPPPPPPLPPALSNPIAMAKKANLMNEIRLIKNCCGENESITDFVRTMHNNKEARQLLPGASKHPASPEDGKQEMVFKKAIDAYQDTRHERQEMQQIKEKLTQLKNMQNQSLPRQQTPEQNTTTPSKKPF